MVWLFLLELSLGELLLVAHGLGTFAVFSGSLGTLGDAGVAENIPPGHSLSFLPFLSDPQREVQDPGCGDCSGALASGWRTDHPDSPQSGLLRLPDGEDHTGHNQDRTSCSACS